ncbi:hypothetical protein HHK36_025640 [Tetracentron sinense]|uniref:Thioesterase domain-containing protein n=1 Tax=Tetracentron sinense TaxID=13715 RepID=A0A834YNK3_TETSI|nr:hypothetical protein HHK36_025640 [Tetracentron sinense]
MYYSFPREREREKMGEVPRERAKEWLEDLAAGRLGQEIETLAHRGIQILQAKRGSILCNFIIPERLSDKDGNWHVGAIATLIDAIGAAAIVSSVGLIKASVHFDVSYFSTAKIHDAIPLSTLHGSGMKESCISVSQVKPLYPGFLSPEDLLLVKSLV